MNLNLKFHHMGLAVKKEESAITFLKQVGYGIGDKVYDPVQNVNLRLCTSKSNPMIEIIMAGEGDGPLTPILNRYNELIYHTCYEVDDLDLCLDAFESVGIRVHPVSPRKPAVLFNGRNVSFYQVVGFGLIELLEN